MKKLIILAILSLSINSAIAQSNDITINVTTNASPFLYGNAELPIVSSFFSRGRLLDQYPVTQPSVTILKDFEFGTILLNVFQNYDVRDKSFNQRLNETDITVGYTKTIDNITIGAGIIDYIYTCQPIINDYEAYFSISFNFPEEFTLNPTFTTYYDLIMENSDYSMVSINHPFAYNDFTLTPDLSIGTATAQYNKYYFGVDKNRVNDVSTGLTLNYSYTKNIVFTAAIRYVTLIDKQIQRNADSIYGNDEQLTERVSVIYNF